MATTTRPMATANGRCGSRLVVQAASGADNAHPDLGARCQRPRRVDLAAGKALIALTSASAACGVRPHGLAHRKTTRHQELAVPGRRGRGVGGGGEKPPATIQDEPHHPATDAAPPRPYRPASEVDVAGARFDLRIDQLAARDGEHTHQSREKSPNGGGPIRAPQGDHGERAIAPRPGEPAHSHGRHADGCDLRRLALAARSRLQPARERASARRLLRTSLGCVQS